MVEDSNRRATIGVDRNYLLELAQESVAIFHAEVPELGQVLSPLEGIDVPPHVATALLLQGLEPGFKSVLVGGFQNCCLVDGRRGL